jgi:hypothetical protein
MVLAAGFGMHCTTGEEPALKEVIEVIFSRFECP